jgi:ABC-type enterochelin transport system substrate-binding protein
MNEPHSTESLDCWLARFQERVATLGACTREAYDAMIAEAAPDFSVMRQGHHARRLAEVANFQGAVEVAGQTARLVYEVLSIPEAVAAFDAGALGEIAEIGIRLARARAAGTAAERENG